MRIAIVANYYSPDMGYLQNGLPPALARLGHDVHVIASTLQPYGRSPFYRDTYGSFLGPPEVEPGEYSKDGVVVTRLPYLEVRGRLGIRGLAAHLRGLAPDVVEVVDHVSITALQAAKVRKRLGFRFFTANHILASVFPPATTDDPGLLSALRVAVMFRLPGRLVNRRLDGCFAPTEDAAEIAVRFFGVDQRKIRYLPLGVDTNIFHPVGGSADAADRGAIRESLGVGKDEILCIYTGRFSADKGPDLLAEAVESLRSRGRGFVALFIGGGEQLDVLKSRAGSKVMHFMPAPRLASYYRASDVGVWPRQESTSMLDASACGLPVIVSDRIRAPHRIEGCGLTYGERDVESLAGALMQLEDPELRSSLGRVGSVRMAQELSWDEIARRRSDEYQAALAVEGQP